MCSTVIICFHRNHLPITQYMLIKVLVFSNTTHMCSHLKNMIQASCNQIQFSSALEWKGFEKVKSIAESCESIIYVRVPR